MFIVGCPVYKREWILSQWFEHVHTACAAVDIEPAFVFVGDPEDPETEQLIFKTGARILSYQHVSANHFEERVWNLHRYNTMVLLRNRLLQGVRAQSPDHFLSLDSDVLLHDQSVGNMLETLEDNPSWSAVGGKAYLTPKGKEAPTYANLNQNANLIRPDRDDVFRCDVIMAIKLMTKSAYSVDYKVHKQGEDIGWSLSCREKGLLLGFDGRVVSKHCMSPEMLNEEDVRCGY